MYRLIILFSLLNFCQLTAQITVNGRISAYENCGQSNSNGVAATSTFPLIFQGVHTSTKIFKPPAFSNTWNIIEAGVNDANAGNSGIDIVVGDSLKLFTGKTTFVVKDPNNGTGLFPNYNGTDFNTANEGKVITRNMASLYDANRALYADSAKLLSVKALVFIQGESDAQLGFAARNYATNLRAFIEKRRLEYRDPNLKIILVRLNNTLSLGAYPFKAEIRAAQTLIASTMSNVVIVENDDAVLPDGSHFDANTMIRVGSRVYNILKSTF